jgi:ATP-dependent protease ClpP protease subunit
MYELFKQGVFLCDIKEEDIILCNEIGEDATNDEDNKNLNNESDSKNKLVYEMFINSVGSSYFLSE